MGKESIFEKRLISADDTVSIFFTLKKSSAKKNLEIQMNDNVICSEEIAFSVNYWIKELIFEGKKYSAVVKENDHKDGYEFMCYCGRAPFSDSPNLGELCALINDPYYGQDPEEVNRIKSAGMSGKLIAFLITAVAIILIDGARSEWWESLLHIGIVSALWGVYHLLDGIGDRKIRKSLIARLNGGSMHSK